MANNNELSNNSAEDFSGANILSEVLSVDEMRSAKEVITRTNIAYPNNRNLQAEYIQNFV